MIEKIKLKDNVIEIDEKREVVCLKDDYDVIRPYYCVAKKYETYIEEGNSWALVDGKEHLLGFVITHKHDLAIETTKKSGVEVIIYACMDGQDKTILELIEPKNDCIWAQTEDEEIAMNLQVAGFQLVDITNIYTKIEQSNK